jgi:hypothetical protein
MKADSMAAKENLMVDSTAEYLEIKRVVQSDDQLVAL